MSEAMETGSVPWRLKDLPPEERPRERLARHGASALSSRELLAPLVGTGSRGASALDLAEGVLGTGLHELASRSLGELERARGLGRAKAARVLAALELGARLASDGRSPGPVFRTPEDSARYLLPRYCPRPVETFGLLALYVRHKLKREAVISVGCLTSSLVHPREVFQEAVVARPALIGGLTEPDPRQPAGTKQRLPKTTGPETASVRGTVAS
jgi:DNA repair protein RadC